MSWRTRWISSPQRSRSPGAKAPEVTVDGVDLSPLLFESKPLPQRPFFYYRGDQLFACRLGEWKAHFKTQTGYGQPKADAHEPPLLFHLGHDPSEKRDVRRMSSSSSPMTRAGAITATPATSRSRTPNIDSIAKGGVSLGPLFVCPVCSPTRAEFLTGRYHPRGGVRGVSTGQERLDLDEKTIADAFKAAGYATGAFGKWHNGSQWPYHPMARGFDEYFGHTSGHWGEYFDAPLEENGRMIRTQGYIVDVCTDRALASSTNTRTSPSSATSPSPRRTRRGPLRSGLAALQGQAHHPNRHAGHRKWPMKRAVLWR
jgi:arylsulfatase A-like enzyme